MTSLNCCCRLALVALVGGTAVLVGACGGSGGAPAQPVMAPAISVQPASQSVPMGLVATFSVSASGSNLQYQWSRDSTAIAGATGATYVTPATTFADSGASFSVKVSNSAGSVDSAAATLAVTARAPRPGDLRFRQVDAPSTVDGYGNAGAALSTFLTRRTDMFFNSSLGMPFVATQAGDCAPVPVTDGTGCDWMFSVMPMAVSATSPGLLAGYGSDWYANLRADLQAGSSWPPFGNGISAASSASVITSLDLEPADALFAVAWTQSSGSSGFDLAIQTVTPTGLQAAAELAGMNSRIITAISNDGGQATFLSYGWHADASTVYEVQVVTVSSVDAASAAASLAAQGYIITATGTADANGDAYLVGTRVRGDTLPPLRGSPELGAASNDVATGLRHRRRRCGPGASRPGDARRALSPSGGSAGSASSPETGARPHCNP